jgi:predicted TIM-barrel fold metal-dependent hydrolase
VDRIDSATQRGSATRDRIISADDHIDLCYLPKELFQQRLPAKYREIGPKVEMLPQGPTWVREGTPWGMWGQKKLDLRINVFAQLDYPEEIEPNRFRATTAKYRLKDMDDDGVDAQIVYNFLNWSFTDQELKYAVIQAFNSWLAEEMCNVAPDRLIGLATLPGHDAKAAITELQRASRLGLKGVIFDVFGATKPIFDPEWEPLWAAAAEAGMPVSVHTGGGTFSIQKAPSGTPWKWAAHAAILGMQLEEVLVSVIYCGMLERNPKLKFVMGEAGIGWLPYVLERLDHEMHQYDHVPNGAPQLKMKPTDLFHRQCYVTFQEESFGPRMIPEIGVDNVMWAADYPHGDGTFPHSQKIINKMFGDAPAELRRKVLGGNAAAVYGL